MPASDLRTSARDVARASWFLLAPAIAIWVAAYTAANSRVVFGFYGVSFDNTVAHRFVGRLAGADDAVLLLGASTTHERFDEAIMNRTRPPLRFVNGGTGMGSIFVYEAMAETLRDSGVRPAAVVLGLHPVALSDRQINFNGAGYTDFFDRWHGWDVIQFDDQRFVADDRREVIWNTWWPGRRVARQSSRLIRSGLYRLHNRWYWGPHLPVAAFERAPDDLIPRPEYIYTAETPVPGLAEVGLAWFRDQTPEWAAPRHRDSLRRTIEHSLQATNRVIVLLMPEHSLLRTRLSPDIRQPLLDIAAEFRSRGVVVIDRSAAMGDDMFVDSIHLLRAGRERFSRQMADELGAALQGASR
jgi:hypothetical protein